MHTIPGNAAALLQEEVLELYRSRLSMLSRIKILVLALLLTGLTCNALLLSKDYPWTLAAGHRLIFAENPHYRGKVSLYQHSQTMRAGIVMLGDSLTYLNNWNVGLGREDIANQGIPGDILDGFYRRLTCVTRLRPRACFIQGGVNDVNNDYQPREIFLTYQWIIEELRARRITPVIQSTLFVASGFPLARERNMKILELNGRLKEYAINNALTYLDINSLVSRNGFLRQDLTSDGIHLNVKGYAIWTAEVAKSLKGSGL